MLFAAALYAGEDKDEAKILKEYRPKIHTIAILPFKDLTEMDGADKEARAAIYKGLSEIDSKKTGIEFIPMDVIDKKLSDMGIKGFSDIKKISIKELGEKLNVDAVIMGKVITYYSPTDDDRFINAILGGTILGHNKARSIVECVLRLYYCPEEKQIWYKVVYGDSKPEVFNIEALATNLRAALIRLSENIASHWPYKKKI